MTLASVQRVLAAAAALALAGIVHATDISGAGATFPYPVYSKWAAAYKQQTGIGLNYQSIGSGGGIKQIKARTVTFGASDMPLEPKDLESSGLIQFPAIIGGVVPVVNIRGIHSGQLVLDGPTIAAIYLGDIKTWNDPAIKRLNPGLALPAQAIAPVYRSDGSGTNFLFTDYLSKQSAKFKDNIGAATSVQWPVGIGAKGNEGLANQTMQTGGAIGYVEYAYAKQNQDKIASVRLVNRAGKIVAPSAASFQAAAGNADWAHSDHYHLILTDQPGERSWPITGASFILVYQMPPDPAATGEVLKFFSWAFRNGTGLAESLDYVPLPAGLIKQIHATWKTIKTQ
ncbi:MAG TPA: phosphate ABC transporter substrate-binding protein PstS [Steroidobacteraceae bacterium]|nr:phosphate ABC transporter substrate-binding protein PstS [Steroidobacteraceae bacterium]